MISTQPGSTPLTSFKILSLDDIDGHGGCAAGTEIGKLERAALKLTQNDSIKPHSFSIKSHLYLFCGFLVHNALTDDCVVCAGPYGERDEQQVFIQRVVPDTDKLYVRLSSNGKRSV